jgi:beta-lactamase superfamily II metal-dependent hydrolase
MSSRKHKPCLVVLDVGHGSAAVLHDEGGTVVFDTGKGAHVARHLQAVGVKQVQALFLSHADADHIGGAATLLMDKTLRVGEVLLNPDPSKDSSVFEQLGYALIEASLYRETNITLTLTTGTKLKRRGATIEVLHPPQIKALAGVGGRSASGKRHTSNSMSAAIRVSRNEKSSVLLAADIEFDCLDDWSERAVHPKACVLVFPHHGGLPHTNDEKTVARFGFEITRMVTPDVVVFSNHRTQFGNPRDAVLEGIARANPSAQYACTQLPKRLHSRVSDDDCWSLHRASVEGQVVEGALRLEFEEETVQCSFAGGPV